MPASRLPAPEPHPALGVLRQRRITNRKVAGVLGVSPAWVGSCLLGQVRVPADFQQGLARLLQMPVEHLFRVELPASRHPGDGALQDRTHAIEADL